MWVKVMLITAVTFVLVSVVVSDEENDLEKRGQTHTLSDVVKMIKKLEKRFDQMESRRLILLRGRDGRDGMPGKQGKEGKDGKPGLQGPRGSPGKDGIRGPPGRNGGGVEYIRWGKTTCPSGADIVYKGRIGGEHYTHHGGGANYVCLPETPQYDQYKPGVQTGAFMYGTEYELSGYLNPFSAKHDLHDHDAVCVACHVKTRSSKLMIPARYDCPAGWTREYHGYLMAQHYTQKSNKEFICVDQAAEAASSGHANMNGALLYVVEGRCGSLPCRPYVEGWELTCAVCTK